MVGGQAVRGYFELTTTRARTVNAQLAIYYI